MLRLRVVPEGDRERWIRDFAGHRLESLQWTVGGLLIEAFGLARLAFRVRVGFAGVTGQQGFLNRLLAPFHPYAGCLAQPGRQREHEEQKRHRRPRI